MRTEDHRQLPVNDPVPGRPRAPRIVASTPLREFPVWAVLQRRLFDILDDAWRLFQATYTEPDGSLRYSGRMFDRDGVDDFYEPFFNWPVLYRLGGSRDILDAAKHHWEGVTAQMTRAGFVKDEYELGYDWFHQGESLIFFYALCAADPDDADFRERARAIRRACTSATRQLGNYDAAKRMIVAPHTGSGGPRWGVGDAWSEYRAGSAGHAPYGLPLRDLDGISTWDDLAERDNARRHGRSDAAPDGSRRHRRQPRRDIPRDQCLAVPERREVRGLGARVRRCVAGTCRGEHRPAGCRTDPRQRRPRR